MIDLTLPDALEKLSDLLPHGSIRFRWEQIEQLILSVLSSAPKTEDRQEVNRG